jgi:hypothetical protein
MDSMIAIFNGKPGDNIARMLPGYRSLINLPNLPEKLTGSFLKVPVMAKSN